MRSCVNPEPEKKEQVHGKTAVIMIGIQASGKSTFSKAEFPEYVRINLDTLKRRHREKQLHNF